MQGVKLVEFLAQLRVLDAGQGGQALLHGLGFVAGQAFLVRHVGDFAQQGNVVGELQPLGFQLFQLAADGFELGLGVVGAGLLHEALQPVLGILQVLSVLVQNLVQKPQLANRALIFLSELLFQVHRVYFVDDVLRFVGIEVVEGNLNGAGFGIDNFNGQVFVQVRVDGAVVLDGEVVAGVVLVVGQHVLGAQHFQGNAGQLQRLAQRVFPAQGAALAHKLQPEPARRGEPQLKLAIVKAGVGDGVFDAEGRRAVHLRFQHRALHIVVHV